MKCIICNNDIDSMNDKYIDIHEGYSHLDCWVTKMFKMGNFDKETFGALAMAIDYLISAKQLVNEVLMRHPEYNKYLLNIINNIDKEISVITDFLLGNIIRR